MIAFIVAAALTATPALPKVAVEELRDNTLLDLLAGISVELELGEDHAFELRALRHVRAGECDPTKPCTKDRLFIVVSTRDEYPNVKGFQMPIVGEFHDIAAVSIPDSTGGAFRLVLRTSPSPDSQIVCTFLDVTLTSMNAKVAPCLERSPRPQRPH